jgi:hypothetical protein
MSPEQKRAVLLKKYNNSEKIKKMSDKQIHVIYMRLQNKGEL